MLNSKEFNLAEYVEVSIGINKYYDWLPGIAMFTIIIVQSVRCYYVQSQLAALIR